ncbi:thioesterase II family protein [Winogradskya humida]|uniref:Thioesterase n=1 Tax=Winogradskya humida TaxID=113566 RepID=A0ABQ4A5N5_9ACTN|nr:alpha/beta fold hydrolase [Actinoplanes humidus]GIE26150.1 thioesterase [Actinoplanes humidus]
MTLADDATTEWIRRYHPATGSTVRLVLFPHAGGGASFFHPVSARFSPGADVVSLQYPGRQDRHREPLVPTIDQLADRVSEQLRQLSPKPSVFFGHSMGAVLAFEVTRRLEITGGGPEVLMASGRRGPATLRAESVHTRDDAGIIRELKLLNGTDLRLLDDEMLAVAMPAIRNDYRAIETYVPRPGATVSCPIVALTGESDPKTTVDEARAWEKHTTGGFRMEVFPGGHFFLASQSAAVNHQIERELKTLA